MFSSQRIVVYMVLLVFWLSSLDAEEDPSKKIFHPINAFITVPFKATFDRGASNGSGTILNIMPFIPATVGDWNLFNRAIIPVANVDGAIVGPNNPSPEQGGAASGLGDINYALLLSPVKYDKFIWGVGPAIALPSASDDQLGSGKWSTGMAAMVLKDFGWGNVLLRGSQIWSFAGDTERKNVNKMVIEPIITYNIGDGWHLYTDPIISANWKAERDNRWIVPLGGGFGRTFKVGKQTLLSRLEAYYNIERPEGAPDYSISFTLQFVFPKE
jgi:hypothetical protein